VLQGTCLLIPPGGEPARLGPGDVVFLRRGSEHILCDDAATPPLTFEPDRMEDSSPIGQIMVDGPGARTVLLCGAYRLDTLRSHPLLDELPEALHLPASPGRHPALRSAVDQLSAELIHPRPGSDSVIATLIDLLLLYILRAWQDDQPGDEAGGWTAALADPGIMGALRAIHSEPGRNWTVESLGAQAGLSRAAFARRFALLVGEPPLAYLTTWRMTAAGRMLRESDAPIAALAARVGYGSEFAFAKAFKREYGIAPGRYRHQFRPGPLLQRSRRG
jgi:AraC-like DNA-binding protein